MNNITSFNEISKITLQIRVGWDWGVHCSVAYVTLNVEVHSIGHIRIAWGQKWENIANENRCNNGKICNNKKDATMKKMPQ